MCQRMTVFHEKPLFKRAFIALHLLHSYLSHLHFLTFLRELEELMKAQSNLSCVLTPGPVPGCRRSLHWNRPVHLT